jgi:deoxyhypusine monooxygenase
MLNTSSINYQYLEDALLNTSGNTPLAERFRALFTLKNIADNRSIDIAAKGKVALLL